jgi:hypothetical protein
MNAPPFAPILEASRARHGAAAPEARVAQPLSAAELEAIGHDQPRRVRAMSDEALEALLGDRRLIRHWGKLSVNGYFNSLPKLGSGFRQSRLTQNETRCGRLTPNPGPSTWSDREASGQC